MISPPIHHYLSLKTTLRPKNQVLNTVSFSPVSWCLQSYLSSYGPRKKTDPGWIENGWNMNFNILPKNLQRQKYFKSQKVKTQPFYLSANCHLLGRVSFQISCIIIKLKISLILKCSFLNCAYLHQSWDIFICPFWEKNQVSEVRRDWCDVEIFYLLFWKNNQVSEVRREWCDVIK